MRAVSVLVLLLLAPMASAEFGVEEEGWPVGADGTSHDPTKTIDPDALAAIQERAQAHAAQAGLMEEGPLGQDYPSVNRIGPATVYPYYPILEAEIQRLVLDHPDKVKLHVGKSTAGLDIHYLEIANWDDPDMKPLAEREVVMIDGGTHSNEYSGVYFVLAIAQWLLDGSPEDEFAQWVLENRHTIITPMVNPDGSHLMGRLNLNTVNINRNFPVLWGGDGTDMLLNNPGPSAMSEVETQLVVEKVEHWQPDYHGSVHCCGNLWLFPYGEEGYDPPDVDMMNHICDVAYPPEIREDCGPIWSTIYPASGSTVDTVYEYTGAVAFGFEMSGRSNLVGPWGEPVTFEEVADQEAESWGGIMHAFANVHLYGAYPVVEAITQTPDGYRLTIRNEGFGNLTGGLVYLSDPADELYDPAGRELPFVAAGEVATVDVPGPVAGTVQVNIQYAKRIMAAPQGHTSLTFQVLEDGLAVPEGVAALTLDDHAGDDQEAPGLGVLVALVAAALIALRRRR